MKIIMNRNVNDEIWLLEGLPGVDLLLLNLRGSLPAGAAPGGGLCSCPWMGCKGEWYEMGP